MNEIFRTRAIRDTVADRSREANAPLLYLKGINRSYGQGDTTLEILKGAELALWPGQSIALVAPSGAGKSTLLHVAGLLEHPDGGEVYVDTVATSRLADSERTRIRRVEIDLEALSAGDLRVAVQFESPFPLDPLVGVVVHSQQGAPLLGSNQLVHGEGYRGAVLRLGVATLTIRDLPLYSGYYKVSIWLCDRHNTRVYDRKIDALGFDLVSRHTLPPGISSEVNGPVRTTASWELTPGTVDTEAISVSASRIGSTNTFPVWKHS